MRLDIAGVAFASTLLLAGCTVRGELGSLTRYTIEDARETLAWVDRQQAGGLISPSRAELARLCPNAVLKNLEQLKADLDSLPLVSVQGVDDGVPDGDYRLRGLIYRLTTKRYGDGGLKAHAKERFDRFVAGCVHLLPVEETIRLIKKARSLAL